MLVGAAEILFNNKRDPSQDLSLTRIPLCWIQIQIQHQTIELEIWTQMPKCGSRRGDYVTITLDYSSQNRYVEHTSKNNNSNMIQAL